MAVFPVLWQRRYSRLCATVCFTLNYIHAAIAMIWHVLQWSQFCFVLLYTLVVLLCHPDQSGFGKITVNRYWPPTVDQYVYCYCNGWLVCSKCFSPTKSCSIYWSIFPEMQNILQLPKELQYLLVQHDINSSTVATTCTTLYLIGQLQIIRRHYPTARQFFGSSERR